MLFAFCAVWNQTEQKMNQKYKFSLWFWIKVWKHSKRSYKVVLKMVEVNVNLIHFSKEIVIIISYLGETNWS